MNVLICINNLVLSEGLRKVIVDNLAEARIEESVLGEVTVEPDIVLFDSRERVDWIKRKYGQARLICIDLGLKETDLACLLFCHGIHGIISPHLNIAMFCKALRAVQAGEIWVDQNHLKAVLREGHALPQKEKLCSLSEQDRRIIRLVASGRKSKDIADLLCLSEATIKAHLSRIYKTLKVQNRSALVALAAESGWTIDQRD